MKKIFIVIFFSISCQKTEQRPILRDNFYQDGDFQLSILSRSKVGNMLGTKENNQLNQISIKLSPSKESLRILKSVNLGNEFQNQSKLLNRYINSEMKNQFFLTDKLNKWECKFYNVEATGFIDNCIRINCVFEVPQDINSNTLALNVLKNPFYNKDLLIPIRLSNLN